MATDEDAPQDQTAHPKREPNFDRFRLIPLDGKCGGRHLGDQ